MKTIRDENGFVIQIIEDEDEDETTQEQKDEDTSNEEKTESDNKSDTENEEASKTDTESKTEDSNDNSNNEDKVESEGETVTSENNDKKEDTQISKEEMELIDELEEMINGASEDLSDNDKENDSDAIDKLEAAAKTISKLKKRNAELELKAAELSKFGNDGNLSPSMVILKANYDKALKGEEEAINKIKKIIFEDLGLELKKAKDVFVSNEIFGDINGNHKSNNGDTMPFAL